MIDCSEGTSASTWRGDLIQTAMVAATTSASVRPSSPSGFICSSAVSAA